MAEPWVYVPTELDEMSQFGNRTSLLKVHENDVILGTCRPWIVDDDPTLIPLQLSDRALRHTLIHSALTLKIFQNKQHRLAQHPMVRWVGADVCNYQWMFALFGEACKEYKYRHDHAHPFEASKDRLANPPYGIPAKWTSNTVPPIVLPHEYQRRTDTVHFRSWQNCILSYRLYYAWEAWSPLEQWTRRTPPTWLGCFLAEIADTQGVV